MDNEEKMKNIFYCFPQFKKDIPALLDVINDQYEWKSETILALYFRWLSDEGFRRDSCKGGLWDPISTVYGIDNQVLSNLASRYNSRERKHEEFEELKIKVRQYREEQKRQEQQERKDRETFTVIKTLIDETNGDDIKDIRTAFLKIKTVLI
ncbi:MAG: hypothetical protein LBC76_00365 [Treponema sp.]|jgi:hypothetical protein|nr:hypothetical protein [Treponema sp.]